MPAPRTTTLYAGPFDQRGHLAAERRMPEDDDAFDPVAESSAAEQFAVRGHEVGPNRAPLATSASSGAPSARAAASARGPRRYRPRRRCRAELQGRAGGVAAAAQSRRRVDVGKWHRRRQRLPEREVHVPADLRSPSSTSAASASARPSSPATGAGTSQLRTRPREDARLPRGLVRADLAQFLRAVAADHDQRDPAVARPPARRAAGCRPQCRRWSR